MFIWFTVSSVPKLSGPVLILIMEIYTTKMEWEQLFWCSWYIKTQIWDWFLSCNSMRDFGNVIEQWLCFYLEYSIPNVKFNNNKFWKNKTLYCNCLSTNKVIWQTGVNREAPHSALKAGNKMDFCWLCKPLNQCDRQHSLQQPTAGKALTTTLFWNT